MSARADLGVCAHGDTIYVIGGTDGHTPLDSGEFLDVSDKEWCGLPNMQTKRAGLAVCVVDGIMHVIGGTDGTVGLDTMETCRLKRHAFDHNLPPMPQEQVRSLQLC